VQNDFHGFKREFAENWMEVMQAQVRDVNLNIFVLVLILTIFIEFLFYFEKTFFDLFFHLWLELLFKVVHFKILPLEILEWLALFFIFLLIFIVLFNRFRDLEISVLGVVSHLALRVDQWQVYLRVRLLVEKLRV
jgi:hypothetical protein